MLMQGCMPSKAPADVEVGLGLEAMALERCHVVRLCRLLLCGVATQVSLLAILSHPDMRLPAAAPPVFCHALDDKALLSMTASGQITSHMFAPVWPPQAASTMMTS